MALLGLLLVAPTSRLEATPALRQRDLFIQAPALRVPEIHVAPHRVTTLRFQVPVDPLGTWIQGGEGRFEPLLAGDVKVVITPVRELAAADRVSLVVVLEDGTEWPFTLVAARGEVDSQVDVFTVPESPEYLRALLAQHRHEGQRLRAELQRCQQEESSVEHLLAGMLAANAQELTSLRASHTEPLGLADWKVGFRRLKSKDRFIFAFTVTNLHPEKPWELGEVRFTHEASGESWPLAVRVSPPSIPPGQSGYVGIASSRFPAKMKDRFLLELTRKGSPQYLQLSSVTLQK
jgi:uncharacterized protein (TIGR02268 family)